MKVVFGHFAIYRIQIHERRRQRDRTDGRSDGRTAIFKYNYNNKNNANKNIYMNMLHNIKVIDRVNYSITFSA